MGLQNNIIQYNWETQVWFKNPRNPLWIRLGENPKEKKTRSENDNLGIPELVPEPRSTLYMNAAQKTPTQKTPTQKTPAPKKLDLRYQALGLG